METVKVYDSKNHLFEIFNDLPNTAVFISHWFNKELKDKLWFDKESKRFIRENKRCQTSVTYKEYKYKIVRSHELILNYTDKTKDKIKMNKAIDYIIKRLK